MKQQATLTITGRVQGVFYRSETQKMAQKLGLSGYVKNNADGSVTAVAQGDEIRLKQFIEWCKKGPEGAAVDKVITTRQPHKGLFTGFEIQ